MSAWAHEDVSGDHVARDGLPTLAPLGILKDVRCDPSPNMAYGNMAAQLGFGHPFIQFRGSHVLGYLIFRNGARWVRSSATC